MKSGVRFDSCGTPTFRSFLSTALLPPNPSFNFEIDILLLYFWSFRSLQRRSTTMPARSAVLNVSITAKPLRDESVIQQVRETSSSPVEVTILDKMAEAHRGRVDSAASTDIPAIDTQFANSPSYVDFSGNSLAATQRGMHSPTLARHELTATSPRVCDVPPNHQARRLSAGALQRLQGHSLLRKGMPEGRLGLPQAQLRPPQQPAPLGFPHRERSEHCGAFSSRLPHLRARLSLKDLPSSKFISRLSSTFT